MSDTLDAVRAKFPQYKDVPDGPLAAAIGNRYPQYMEADKDFAAEAMKGGQLPAAPDIANQAGLPAGTKMTPDGPVSDQDKAAAVLSVFPEFSAKDPIELAKIATTHALSGGFAAPVVDAATSYAGNLARGVVADVATTASGDRASLTDPRSNILAALKGQTKLPIDQAISDAEDAGGNVAGTVARISDKLSASLPMLLGMSKLPTAVQQQVGRAFVGQMVLNQADTAKELYGELQKPEGQRDQKRINDLIAGAAVDGGFLGLAAYAGRPGGKARDLADQVNRNVADAQLPVGTEPTPLVQTDSRYPGPKTYQFPSAASFFERTPPSYATDPLAARVGSVFRTDDGFIGQLAKDDAGRLVLQDGNRLRELPVPNDATVGDAGLRAVSLGATRVVNAEPPPNEQSYPADPMPVLSKLQTSRNVAAFRALQNRAAADAAAPEISTVPDIGSPTMPELHPTSASLIDAVVNTAGQKDPALSVVYGALEAAPTARRILEGHIARVEAAGAETSATEPLYQKLQTIDGFENRYLETVTKPDVQRGRASTKDILPDAGGQVAVPVSESAGDQRPASPATIEQKPTKETKGADVQTSAPTEGVSNEPVESSDGPAATAGAAEGANSGGAGPAAAVAGEPGSAAAVGERGAEPITTPAEVQQSLPLNGEPKTYAMAAGGAGASRAQNAGAPRGGTRPTVPPVSVPHSPGTKPASNGVLATIGKHLAAARTFMQSLVSPQNIDPTAKLFSLVLRENNGRMAAEMIRSEEAMNVFRRQFDRTPVDLKNYVYDPTKPLPHNFQVMDAFERNRAALPPDLQQLGKTFDSEFAARIAEIQRFKPELLKNLIGDYFPHIWQSPDGGAVREFMAEVAARAPLQGNKAFLKQRSLAFFADGLARGLKPVHDNPVDLLMAKMHQMDKFIMALRTIDEAKARGWMKWLPIGQRLPEGARIVDDPAFTVHAPPYVEVKEAFDAGIRKGLMDFIGKMGFTHERVAMVKVQGLMNAFGLYRQGGEIQSRFGGPDGVIMHEIGHGLDERYGLFNVLAANKSMAAELKGLADLRMEPGQKASAKFTQYLHMPEEQVANAVHAYIYAPELMEQKAPTVRRAMAAFIGAHPELEDLNTIKPSLAIAQSKMRLPTAGPILAGHWTLPEGAAQVLTNHLSPGLSQWWPYRTLRAGSNILNAAQLGLSGFHLGFTSLDAAFSTLGTAITEVSRGNIGQAGALAMKAAAAPVLNYLKGRTVQREMIAPGITGDPRARMVAELAVRAGLRATVDPFWKTEFTRNLVRAWSRGTAGGVAESMFRLPFAAIEQSMRPIAEYVVPRQKLGVFATIAESEMRRLGPGASADQVRGAMAKAADMTENRMGQLTYDNLFYNRMVKDASLVAFRAYGWQLGKYRELAGVLGDSARFVKDIAQVKKPEFTNRMGYAAALVAGSAIVGGIMHRLMTGQSPQTAMDYFHPGLGRKDDNGNEARLSMPTYLKDLESDAKYMTRGWDEGGALGLVKGLWNSSYHRLNPAAGFAVDMMNNRDFFGTQIWNANDPWTAKALDQAQFVAKQFTPFSVIGAAKLKHDDAGPLQWALPFVGFVPAKKALTMTPAEVKAAEIAQASMPSAPRTAAQAEHSQVVKSLVQDYRNGKLNDQGQLVARARAAGLTDQTPQGKAELSRIEQRMVWTPLQYQVNKMPLKDAMQVFDLANERERQTLAPAVAQKIQSAYNSGRIDQATASQWVKVVTPWYQRAVAAKAATASTSR